MPELIAGSVLDCVLVRARVRSPQTGLDSPDLVRKYFRAKSRNALRFNRCAPVAPVPNPNIYGPDPASPV